MQIRHATIYRNGWFAPDTSLRVENGVITAFDDQGAKDALDLQGDYLLPAFVDTHIHAFQGMDTMRGEADVRRMSRELRKIGVGAFLPTTMSASPEATRAALAGIAAVMERPEPDGAAVLGAHMEAPFLQPDKAGAQQTDFFALPTVENWRRYTGEYASVVRVVTLAPELEGALELIETLSNEGIAVSIGHTAATAEQVHAAADHGACRVTHTFNAQSPLQHRAPGVPGAAMVDERLYCELICDGVHLHPDTVRLLVRCKGASRAVAITDAMEAAGMPDGTYQLGGQQVFVKQGEARLSNGTLAGSTLTMPRALQNLIAFGIAPETAVSMLTATPADSIGEANWGRIGIGAPGVFVRFGKDWSFKGCL